MCDVCVGVGMFVVDNACLHGQSVHGQSAHGQLPAHGQQKAVVSHPSHHNLTSLNVHRKTDTSILLALAQHRRHKGQIHFGVLMAVDGQHDGQRDVLHVGQSLTVDSVDMQKHMGGGVEE